MTLAEQMVALVSEGRGATSGWPTQIGTVGEEMSITDAGVNKGSRTLADRFTAYLENVTSSSHIALLVRSFELSLRAANKSPKTIKSYTDTVRGFCIFLVDNGMPTDARNLTREHVETYISVQVERFGQRQPRFGSVTFNSSSSGPWRNERWTPRR